MLGFRLLTLRFTRMIPDAIDLRRRVASHRYASGLRAYCTSIHGGQMLRMQQARGRTARKR